MSVEVFPTQEIDITQSKRKGMVTWAGFAYLLLTQEVHLSCFFFLEKGK